MASVHSMYEYVSWSAKHIYKAWMCMNNCKHDYGLRMNLRWLYLIHKITIQYKSITTYAIYKQLIKQCKNLVQ